MLNYERELIGLICDLYITSKEYETLSSYETRLLESLIKFLTMCNGRIQSYAYYYKPTCLIKSHASFFLFGKNSSFSFDHLSNMKTNASN